MSHKAADRIRNVALIGHRDCGKTSLAEAMLYEAGAINRLGRVGDGSTVSDFEPDEQEREMSIGAAICSFEHGGRKINLIDTPGDPGFVAEALGALAVVDAAVVVVSAVDGVQVHTERLWARADEAGLPRLVFVNMLDRERADFFRTLEGLQESFGSHVVATEIPIGAEHEVGGVIDLIDMRAFLHDSDGRGEEVEADIPDDLAETAQRYREKLMDEVAENSDELMERYLEGDEISHDEIVTALKKGVTEGHLFPVTCGIATRDLGIERLLQALIEDLPSPAMRGARVLLGEDGEEVEVEPDENGGLIAQVFKTTADPFTGRLNVLRVLAGTLRSDSHVHNERSGAKERIGQLTEPIGKELSPIDELGAGDIGVVAKLKETTAGDLLCEPARGLRAPKVELPAPVMAYAYEPKSKGDEDKAVTAIRRLREEDPCLDVHRDPQTGEQIIAGLTQVHVDVVLGRMKERFGAEITLKPPRVPYVETIRQGARAHARYKKQTGGRGQFGDCWLEVSPLPRGGGFEFVDEVKGGTIPGQFLPAVEKGVRQVLAGGAVAGFPIQDVRVVVYDGKHHPVDSKEVAFIAAGKRAFLDAIGKAQPQVLEPIVELEVSAPEQHMGDVSGGLASKRARISGTDTLRSGEIVVRAQVPLSELEGYAAELKSATAGRGRYALDFSHYEPVPAQVQKKLAEAYKPRHDED